MITPTAGPPVTSITTLWLSPTPPGTSRPYVPRSPPTTKWHTAIPIEPQMSSVLRPVLSMKKNMTVVKLNEKKEGKTGQRVFCGRLNDQRGSVVLT